MNNIYVEIKEKCCSQCDAECDGCWLEELITDRLAEERKKVVQEIRERLTKYTLTNDDFLFDTYYKAVDVEKVLDQIDKFERGV